jgi:YHS domain-containing protein
VLFRGILYLLTIVVIITVVRAVIGIVAKAFSSLAGPPSGPVRPHAPAAPEMLHKDPVCGTYVAPSTAFRKTRGGETYYFCSAACRDKFQG